MLHFLSATLSQYFIMIKNSLEVCHIGTYFYKKWHMKHLCAKRRLLAKNEKLTAIICTETFVDDLLSIKLSFENVFLFPRRHLYLIHILWIIEKHKYDKSAELRRIKSFVNRWMNVPVISHTTERLSNLHQANKNKSKGVIFVVRRLTLLEKINLFFTISCNNKDFMFV